MFSYSEIKRDGFTEKEGIRVTPDQLGYKDQGMMKGQRLNLSAQTDALKKLRKKKV